MELIKTGVVSLEKITGVGKLNVGQIRAAGCDFCYGGYRDIPSKMDEVINPADSLKIKY